MREFVMMAEFDKGWIGLGLNDDDLLELQYSLVENPKAGDVIKGTRGLRKIRWHLTGMGKRKGARIIYVDFVICEMIYLIAAYAKNEMDDLTSGMKKEINKRIATIESELKSGRRTLI